MSQLKGEREEEGPKRRLHFSSKDSIPQLLLSITLLQNKPNHETINSTFSLLI